MIAILHASPVNSNKNKIDKISPRVRPILILLGVYASLSMHRLKFG